MSGGGGGGRRGFGGGFAVAGGAVDRSIISQIMLRFRPIAPKPANDVSFHAGYTAEGSVSRRRVKRRYRFRVRKKNNNFCDDSTGGSDVAGGGTGSGHGGAAATLQLLPVTEKGEESAGTGSEGSYYGDMHGMIKGGGALKIGGGGTAEELDRAVVQSRVTVESVGDACMGPAGDNGSLGSTDVERMRRLEVDTCPAFVTDSAGRVQWVNAAYEALVGGEGAEVRVEVAAKEELPCRRTAFTCQVKVEHYTWRHGKYSKVVPCDVWSFDWGGFAWRLDVKAALGLGF